MPESKPARERILDAAAEVMRSKGLANATTKAIAAQAGYSEAMLYKHFADKQDLFLAVLKERLPAVRPAEVVAGEGDFATNLTAIVERLMAFFVEMFPMSGSIIGAPDLLAQHRVGVRANGGLGPTGPIVSLQSYLDAEKRVGRVRAEADTASVAQLLVGAAFQQGFLATFEGLADVPDAAAQSRALVSAVLPAL